MEGKSQRELEEPVKGYQLEPLKVGVQSANSKLDELKEILDSFVTQKQLDEEIEKIHLKYGPPTASLKWFTRAVVMLGIGLIIQLAVTIATANRGS